MYPPSCIFPHLIGGYYSLASMSRLFEWTMPSWTSYSAGLNFGIHWHVSRDNNCTACAALPPRISADTAASVIHDLYAAAAPKYNIVPDRNYKTSQWGPRTSKTFRRAPQPTSLKGRKWGRALAINRNMREMMGGRHPYQSPVQGEER